jgi:hypothetical protein
MKPPTLKTEDVIMYCLVRAIACLGGGVGEKVRKLRDKCAPVSLDL